MSTNLGGNATKDRVWIKASYPPALLKAIQSQKKEGETIPQAVARFISVALAQSDRFNRRKKLS
jgi:hypothetical protein